VEDGGEEYVSVITAGHRTGLDVTWQERFAVVPHDVGEVQSLDTTRARSRNVRDTAELDLTLLQSDPQVKKGK